MFERWKHLGNRLRTQIKVCEAVLRDDRTPRAAKWLLGLAIGYALLPVDLVPDFIPVVGHLDDIVIIPALIALAFLMVPESVIIEARRHAGNDNGSPAADCG